MTATRDGRRGRRGNRTRSPGIPAQPHPVGRATGGQAIEGPAFYVWDEDPRQAREWGVELADAWLARSPSGPR